jgi:hypothetical protein
VADDEAVAAAAEAAVGDERDVFAEALAHDGAGRGKHLAHAGAALRAFVADDDDVALLDLAVEDGLQRVSSESNTMALPVKLEAFLAGDLGDRAAGARLPLKMTRWLSFLIGLSKRADDPGRPRIGLGRSLRFSASSSCR